ncbi:asparagine synthetase domain-containing protein 1-like protein [Leptotrombidium deliense]|uniref:Asparagine synthetase domain-containing protein 1-like protein n=1 Tax=Leptotrombidium deliense TaxID=299467 RepID=A0A443SH06_9ACAR|nr:asparagine synthetase domain-containing protein 1-like protein [Leptotrombidium deliense]
MCAIFACICDQKEKAIERLQKIEPFLRRRGPDCSRIITVEIEDCHKEYTLVLFASVLHLRGDKISEQPFEDEFGNLLLWNGEIFTGFDELQLHSNDTVLLSQKLSSCKLDFEIVNCFSRIRGPHSFVYWQKSAKKLWFGRDFFGRRSLCWNKDEHSHIFTVASVVGFSDDCDQWCEIPTSGIYSIDFKTDFNFNPSLFKWTSLVTNDRETNDLCVPAPINTPLNTNITNTETADHISESDAVVEQFLSVLNEAVRIRVQLQNNVCSNCVKVKELANSCNHSVVAVLFSGGLDSTLLAFLANTHIPENIPIDLINVAFDEKAADRLTAISALSELKNLCPRRQWNFVKVDVPLEKLRKKRDSRIKYLIHPLNTVLDDSIGCALWFAARGKGLLNEHRYTSPARIVLLGMGADEQLAGYTRHRRVYDTHGLCGLLSEIELELQRISTRNLGRDDRIVSDSGREARYPFLDETVVNYLNSLPVYKKCNLDKPRGFGEKLLLRYAAKKLGFTTLCEHHKRAIQFGTGIAKLENRSEKANNVCNRLKLC